MKSETLLASRVVAEIVGIETVIERISSGV